MNQPQVHVCPLPLEPPSHLPPHPTPLGCHRVLGFSSLLYTVNSHWPSISHMVMRLFPSYSLHSFHLLLPPNLFLNMSFYHTINLVRKEKYLLFKNVVIQHSEATKVISFKKNVGMNWIKIITHHPTNPYKIYLKNENYVSVHSVIFLKNTFILGERWAIYVAMLCF